MTRCAAGAEERPAHLAAEAVAARAMTQIVELVEVGVLAEGRRRHCPVSTGRSALRRGAPATPRADTTALAASKP